MQFKASSFMPINPSTDPVVYNTGLLICIRAGSPELEGEVGYSPPHLIIFFAFSTSPVSHPKTLHSQQSTHTHTVITHSWVSPTMLVTLFACKYSGDEMRKCFCGAEPSTTSWFPPHIPPSFWFPPPLVGISSLSCYQSAPPPFFLLHFHSLHRSSSCRRL